MNAESPCARSFAFADIDYPKTQGKAGICGICPAFILPHSGILGGKVKVNYEVSGSITVAFASRYLL